MDDLGDPISYAVLESGVPVYSADDVRIGDVSHVLAAEDEDIFDGIVLEHLAHDIVGHGGRHRFVDAPEVAAIHERGVTLSIDASACVDLPEPSENPGEYTVNPGDPDGFQSGQPSPLGRKLRRAWDVVSGNW